VNKYSKTIDRESSYEILSRKIEDIEKEKTEQEAGKECEMESGRPSMVKVLTSATFIRGVMGILKKTMR
jgi:hypothetical protein